MSDERKQPTPLAVEESRRELIERYSELLTATVCQEVEQRDDDKQASRSVPTPDAHVRIELGAAEEVLVSLLDASR